MNKPEYRSILQSPYQRNNWLRFLNDISNTNTNRLKDTLQAQNLSSSFVADSYPIKALFKIGTFITSDKQSLPIYEITIKDNIKIERNKVGVNLFIKNVVLKQQGIKAALCVFKYDNTIDNPEWRFSFISKFAASKFFSDIEAKETLPKKYTYIFGTKEQHRTAIDCFQTLKSSTFKINDFFDAFSVEKVSSEFFKGYKEKYDILNEEISKVKLNRTTIFDGDDKAIRDFSKRLLGRIIFLYFLQKKRWLGATNKEYKDGKPDFLYKLYTNSKCQDDGNDYYIKKLTELFFDTLNQERKDDNYEMPSVDGKKEILKVPYLNGGLFDDSNEPPGYDQIFIPNWVFQNLFDFLNEYNFTIDENSPEEHTMAVDPEMMGNIFEDLNENRKEKGAFYTPKVIVQYMCQESITEYLKTHLSDISSIELEKFVKKQELGQLSDEQLNSIFDKLYQIKICDPAIGSGAFPMGILQEIFQLEVAILHKTKYLPQDVINQLDNTNAKKYYDKEISETNKAEIFTLLKENIIQNSIYGVDIEQGAVDIARLRFWLSLVVDQDIPKPLPNLAYKIVVGNSLFSTFKENAIKLDWDTDSLKAGLFKQQTAIEKNKLFKDLSFLQKDYFFANSKNKEKLNTKIRKITLQLLEKQLELTIAKEGFEESDNGKLTKKQARAYLETQIWKETLLDIKKLEKSHKEFAFFDWDLTFPEVFNPLISDNTGFDIVIGNPPYIQLQKMGETTDVLQNEDYSTFSRTGDIYALFYEQGNILLKSKGILSYITSNTWMRTKSGKGLRKYFVEETNLLKLLNFEDTQVFPTATVEVNILVSKKEDWNGEIRATPIKSDYVKGTDIDEYESTNNVKLTEISEDSWVILDAESTIIKRKIEAKGIALKEWDIQFYRGFLTGFNDAFFITEKDKNTILAKEPKAHKIIKPLLRGREIKKYGYNFTRNYVLFIPWHFPLEKENISGASKAAEKAFQKEYPVVYAHLDSFKPNLSNRNKSETGIRYEWYALQRAAASYYEEFNKEKIVWLSISDKPAFALDNNNMHVTAPAYIMTSNHNKYLLALLNSKVMEWYLDKVSSSTGQGTNQWSKIFVEQLPIPQLNDKELQSKFERFVDYLNLLNNKELEPVNDYADNIDIAKSFEEVLNMMVYELYFKEEMIESEIDVLQFITDETFKPIKVNLADNKELLGSIYKSLQKQENPIRNRIILANLKSKKTIRLINSTTF